MRRDSSLQATFRFARCRWGLLVALMSCVAWPAAAQVPGRLPAQPVALVGAHIHPVVGTEIPQGTIVIDQGRIVAIGAEVVPPSNAQIVQVTGAHIYPGLFNAGGQLGLVEINSIRATQDSAETGSINPNARVQVAVNPESELIPVTRANGVLLACSMPHGSLVSGMSAVLQLDGWTWEEMTLKSPAALHVDWPGSVSRAAWWEESSDAPQAARERIEALEKAFEAARHYHRGRAAGVIAEGTDLRWEAMGPVLERTVPVMVRADRLLDIQAAVAFAQRQSIRLIIHGGYDAESCAPLLRAHDVPVIVPAVFRLPRRRSDAYDAPYTLANRLREAGVRYCLSGDDRFEAANLRNLPYHAATAVAYGLPAEEGLRAITLYPAQILGVDNRVGSLEVGKDATLIVTNGDPLQTSTQVMSAYIGGRPVDLANRHERLRHKYEQKYQPVP